MILRAICHENQSRSCQLQDQLITTPTWSMKTSITCLLIYVKFPFFFPLTYNFLCLQGPISYSRIVFGLLKVTLDRLSNENSTALTKVHADQKRAGPMARFLACSRRSDSRAREKNSRRKKMRVPLCSPLSRFPDVQFNSLPTDRRALLSERLEQATRFSKRGLAVKFASLT